MKKITAIAAALALTLALTACGAAGVSGSSSAAEADSSSSTASVGMANPWTDVATAEEAAEGAGVGTFEVPALATEINGLRIDLSEFRYMDLLAEANGYAGAGVLTVRKGVNNPDHEVGYDTADVSGDYNTYAHEWEVEAGDWKVKCFGNEEGRAMKAIWQSDNFSYSINVRGQGDTEDTFGLDEDVLTGLVAAIA